MPYSIIQRENSPYDIVLQANSPENAFILTLGLVGKETKDVDVFNIEKYKQNGSFKVCDGVFIKSDSFNFDMYSKRGIAMWLTEKNVINLGSKQMTPKFELNYFTEKAFCNHYLLGTSLYKYIKQRILDELEEMTHDEKIERLIEIINERYYYNNGFDDYGRYTKSISSIKAPYNLFEYF
jgi:hypothetical protein